MTEISPGAIVTCPRATGSILYVVDRRADDGVRWKMISKRIDHRGRTDSTRRISGSGDCVVIRAAPTFEPAQSIEHEGKFHEIVADNGDSVTLAVPEHSHPIKGGGALVLSY